MFTRGGNVDPTSRSFVFPLTIDHFCFTFSLCTVLANPKTQDPNTLSKSASDQIAKISIGSCVFVFDLPHADNVAAAAARKTVVVAG